MGIIGKIIGAIAVGSILAWLAEQWALSNVGMTLLFWWVPLVAGIIGLYIGWKLGSRIPI